MAMMAPAARTSVRSHEVIDLTSDADAVDGAPASPPAAHAAHALRPASDPASAHAPASAQAPASVAGDSELDNESLFEDVLDDVDVFDYAKDGECRAGAGLAAS